MRFVCVLAYISQCAAFQQLKGHLHKSSFDVHFLPVIICPTLYERTDERTTATTGWTGGPMTVSPGGGCVDKKCYKESGCLVPDTRATDTTQERRVTGIGAFPFTFSNFFHA